jgi:predicted adenylyl cyclase CyaB
MSVNIEIKARARNFDAALRSAERLSDTAAVLLIQEDTFFNVSRGRLKLRSFSDHSGELIYYMREDSKDAKRSDYSITKTLDPAGLKGVLSLAYGIRGVVRKRRLLYMSGQTRIHLDDVEGLGHFIELEYVVHSSEDLNRADRVLQALMTALEISEDDLVPQAYIDLLTA